MSFLYVVIVLTMAIAGLCKGVVDTDGMKPGCAERIWLPVLGMCVGVFLAFGIITVLKEIF